MNAQDLTPAIIQDSSTGRVLMLGWMNDKALEMTRATGFVHFWSRSRERLWKKGETSGNTLSVESIKPDCDNDTLLIAVIPSGPTCHTGDDTCWGETNTSHFSQLDVLWGTVTDRAALRPGGSYTAKLIENGTDAIGRKVTEESIEVLMAARDHAAGRADDLRLAEEVADLMYHVLVLCAERGLEPSAVMDVLTSRTR